MATPTDLRDRNRHPEDFARPDDPNLLRTWTGIGAPGNSYDWDKNPVHGSQSETERPIGRPEEKLIKPKEATEWIPIRQAQVDPWSLTAPQKVKSDEPEILKPTEEAPVSDVPIQEYVPPVQEQRNPWELTSPRRFSSKEPEVHKPLDNTPISSRSIRPDFVPPTQKQRDPWSFGKPTVVVLEESQVKKPTAPDPVSTLPIVEFQPDAGRLKDPWKHVQPHQARGIVGSTAADVPKTK
jgi:hypothetical protein